MAELTTIPTLEYTKADFVSDQQVRWCPGCGDYAILNSMQQIMPKIGKKKEDIVFVSGIGCSSRFPYYMNTYGFHTIHGRAPSIATGLKLANPNLSVWVITGDGDGLSIGGNHFIHVLRRNVNLNIILFNNEIYGLTKGQYSPTSRQGTVAKSTPYGSVDRAFYPGSLALGAEATFYARTVDTDLKHMQEMFLRAERHHGTSVVEVLQNCVIFNDDVHSLVTSKETRVIHQLRLEHGKPMVFGEGNKQGIRLVGYVPEVVTLGENGITEADILVHHENTPDSTLAYLLSRFVSPAFPTPLGVFRDVAQPVYDDSVLEQINEVKTKKGEGHFEKLFSEGETWTVK